jgi:hypothetical protein
MEARLKVGLEVWERLDVGTRMEVLAKLRADATMEAWEAHLARPKG